MLELRVALTSAEYDRMVQFHAAGLGVAPAKLWIGADDRALILALGGATLEIFDGAHAAAVDQIEAGRQTYQQPDPLRPARSRPQAAIDRLIAHWPYRTRS